MMDEPTQRNRTLRMHGVLSGTFAWTAASGATAVLAGLGIAHFGLAGAAVALALAGIGAFLAAPLPAALAVILATPLYNIGVVKVAGVADLRILQPLWLLAAASLLARAAVRKPVHLARPTGLTFRLLAVVVAWESVAWYASGGGMRGAVEVLQTVYLVVVAWLVAGLVGGLTRAQRARLLRVAGLVAAMVLGWSLVAYAVSALAVPFLKVTAGPGVAFEIVRDQFKPQVIGPAGFRVVRFGALNLGPVATAALAVSLFPVALAAIVSAASIRDKSIAWAALGLSVIALALTFSRTGWLVALAELLVVGGAGGLRRSLVIVALGIFAAISVASLPTFSARLAEVADPREGSNVVHRRMTATSLYMANARPVTGWGPGAFKTKGDSLGIGAHLGGSFKNVDAHNFLLQEAADVGWVGAALLAAALVALFGTSLKALRRNADFLAFGVWVAALGYCAMNLTLNAFRAEPMWVLFGILLGATRPWEYGQAPPHEGDSAPALTPAGSKS